MVTKTIKQCTRDNNNIYTADYTIPKGREKEDIKAREKIINAIYRKWTAENPEKCKSCETATCAKPPKRYKQAVCDSVTEKGKKM